MKKLYLGAVIIVTATVSFNPFVSSPASAGEIGWKTCYHTDRSSGETVRLGFISLWETCQGSSKIMDKLNEQHSTGIVRDSNGDEYYKAEIMHRVDDPNCVIDTNTHSEPDY